MIDKRRPTELWHNPLVLNDKISNESVIFPLKVIVKANSSLSVSRVSYNFYADTFLNHIIIKIATSAGTAVSCVIKMSPVGVHDIQTAHFLSFLDG